MKTMVLRLIPALVAAIGSAQGDTPAFVLGDVLPNQPSSFTGTKGWSFIRSGPGRDIAITHLGVFDGDGDGLANAHEVGLWKGNNDNMTGTLLASVVIPAGTEAPLIGGYRYVEIMPVIIPYALGGFVVAAQYADGDADDLVTPRPSTQPFSPAFQIAPDIFASQGGLYGLGSDLPYPRIPTYCGEGCLGEQFWEPNFQYVIVPEPSLWLVALTLLFLGLRRPAVRGKEDGRMQNEESANS